MQLDDHESDGQLSDVDDIYGDNEDDSHKSSNTTQKLNDSITKLKEVQNTRHPSLIVKPELMQNPMIQSVVTHARLSLHLRNVMI